MRGSFLFSRSTENTMDRTLHVGDARRNDTIHLWSVSCRLLRQTLQQHRQMLLRIQGQRPTRDDLSVQAPVRTNGMQTLIATYGSQLNVGSGHLFLQGFLQNTKDEHLRIRESHGARILLLQNRDGPLSTVADRVCDVRGHRARRIRVKPEGKPQDNEGKEGET
jgi:hypothetical protein